MAWVFGGGRFGLRSIVSSEYQIGSVPIRSDQRPSGSGRYILADLIVKIIDDFRHLLALIIVAIFALALGYVMVKTSNQYDQLKGGIEVVVASLGGIVGSILGYYFGESAALKSFTNKSAPDDGTTDRLGKKPEEEQKVNDIMLRK